MYFLWAMLPTIFTIVCIIIIKITEAKDEREWFNQLTPEEQLEWKRQQEEEKKDRDLTKAFQVLNKTNNGLLLYGLGVKTSHIKCTFYFNRDDNLIDFSVGGVHYHLSFDKILNIECQSECEVKKQYVDNGSGALTGALLGLSTGSVLLGAVGSFAGGGTKTITDEEEYLYLIITYINKNNDIDYISVQCNEDWYGETGLVTLKRYNILTQQKSVIDL